VNLSLNFSGNLSFRWGHWPRCSAYCPDQQVGILLRQIYIRLPSLWWRIRCCVQWFIQACLAV